MLSRCVLLLLTFSIAPMPHNILCVSQIAGNLDEVTDIKFLNDSHIVMATNSPQLKVFDLATGSTCLMQGHKTNIVCVTVCAKEQLIATGDKVRT